MKVVSVVGARPQFIKAFPVSAALRHSHTEVLVHTGQHYDHELSEVFFQELDIPEPGYNLGVGSDTHGRQTAAIMAEIEPVLEAESPDAVIVYGDTNSTVAAALVAAKTDAIVAHVESGLRSGNRSMPEELNRILTDHASDVLFAPTDTAVDNLSAEGLGDRTIQSGDVMVDSLEWTREQLDGRATERPGPGVVDTDEYLLLTVHREANTTDKTRLQGIIDAVGQQEQTVIFPIHPRTKAALRRYGLYEQALETMHVIPPVSYFDSIALIDQASVLVTDSGGMQKEAFLLDTPCVTLRDETEWDETVEAGWNVLVGADPDRIRAVLATHQWPSSDHKPQPYGDGTAAQRIVSSLEDIISLETPTIPTSLQ